ncbi:MAG: hypothetical protein AAFO06_16640 [Cyanobacteria bacterium J06597_16]
MDMQTVEFQGKVKNGVIEVPEPYQTELNGEFIRVIVMRPNRKKTNRDFIDELMENPIKFEGKPLTREEIYDRGL